MSIVKLNSINNRTLKISDKSISSMLGGLLDSAIDERPLFHKVTDYFSLTTHTQDIESIFKEIWANKSDNSSESLNSAILTLRSKCLNTEWFDNNFSVLVYSPRSSYSNILEEDKTVILRLGKYDFAVCILSNKFSDSIFRFTGTITDSKVYKLDADKINLLKLQSAIGQNKLDEAITHLHLARKRFIAAKAKYPTAHLYEEYIESLTKGLNDKTRVICNIIARESNIDRLLSAYDIKETYLQLYIRELTDEKCTPKEFTKRYSSVLSNVTKSENLLPKDSKFYCIDGQGGYIYTGLSARASRYELRGSYLQKRLNQYIENNLNSNLLDFLTSDIEVTEEVFSSEGIVQALIMGGFDSTIIDNLTQNGNQAFEDMKKEIVTILYRYAESLSKLLQS